MCVCVCFWFFFCERGLFLFFFSRLLSPVFCYSLFSFSFAEASIWTPYYHCLFFFFLFNKGFLFVSLFETLFEFDLFSFSLWSLCGSRFSNGRLIISHTSFPIFRKGKVQFEPLTAIKTVPNCFRRLA